MFPSASAAATGSAAPGASALDGVEVTYEDSQKITWYSPKIEPWRMLDFWIYPTIARADDGPRKLLIVIIVKDPSKGRPTSLQIEAGEEAWIVPVLDSEKIKTHDSGCRVTQTIFLQNQASSVLKLADATQASIALVGYQHTVHYTMTADDLANFRRIAALWSAPVLPPMPSRPIEEGVPAGTVAAGEGGVTNPVPIRSSRVEPRFPRFAQGKRAYGPVVLGAVVHKDGTVGEIEVRQGAGGDCGFEESAIEAVRKWRYKPATVDGQPVDVYFTIVVDFVYRR
jgi:TonB family protein